MHLKLLKVIICSPINQPMRPSAPHWVLLSESFSLHGGLAGPSVDCPTERCPSGRRCNSRKVVWCKPPWVQIPPAPLPGTLPGPDETPPWGAVPVRNPRSRGARIKKSQVREEKALEAHGLESRCASWVPRESYPTSSAQGRRAHRTQAGAARNIGRASAPPAAPGRSLAAGKE
jgi:hypothetical protein